MSIRAFALAAVAVGTMAVSAEAVSVASGLYRLHNHPDGQADPPPYGARFDELFNATSGHDIFTLDFDDPSSSVFMTVDVLAGVINIAGTALGGRDTGATYAADVYLGLYSFNFTYDIGVQQVPGDDDIWVVMPHHRNFGTITAPNSLGTIVLTDEGMGGYTFRLGDEDNDAGHRGHNGISGWGWMSYVVGQSITHVEATDWLFTAELVPAPGSIVMLGLGGLLAARRRR
jgi:hypothetical protein